MGGKGPDKADRADTEEPMKKEEENGRERKLERVTRMKGRNRQDKKERATDNNVKESSGRNALIYSVGYLRTVVHGVLLYYGMCYLAVCIGKGACRLYSARGQEYILHLTCRSERRSPIQQMISPGPLLPVQTWRIRQIPLACFGQSKENNQFGPAAPPEKNQWT